MPRRVSENEEFSDLNPQDELCPSEENSESPVYECNEYTLRHELFITSAPPSKTSFR